MHLFDPVKTSNVAFRFRAKRKFGQNVAVAMVAGKAAMSGVIQTSGRRSSLATSGRTVGVEIAP
jgi:hypothetical protein